MPDIAMCPGVDCPIKDTCYRHTAKEGFWQSWIQFVYSHEHKECHDFIEDLKSA